MDMKFRQEYAESKDAHNLKNEVIIIIFHKVMLISAHICGKFAESLQTICRTLADIAEDAKQEACRELY